MNCQCDIPLRLTGHVQRKQLPKCGVAFAHVHQAPAFMTVDLLYTGLLPHQGPLLYVQHTVFYARYAVAYHAVVVEHAAVPILRIIRHGHVRPLPAAGNAAAKAQLSQSPIEQGGIARGDKEVFLVHGFGLERPGAVPLKPELLLHHKSVLHKVVRDNAADLFAGLALFTVGGVDQIPADTAALAVGSSATKGAGQLLLTPHCLFHLSPPLLVSATHADAGALRTGFSLAARRSRKSTGFVSFDEAHYTSNFKPFCLIAQIAARADTSPYSSTKICTFLHNKKSRSSSGFFSFGHEKRRLSFVDGRLC